MADIQALFKELSALKPEEAGQLKDMLKAKMPQSTPKDHTDEKQAGSADEKKTEE